MILIIQVTYDIDKSKGGKDASLLQAGGRYIVIPLLIIDSNTQCVVSPGYRYLAG